MRSCVESEAITLVVENKDVGKCITEYLDRRWSVVNTAPVGRIYEAITDGTRITFVRTETYAPPKPADESKDEK